MAGVHCRWGIALQETQAPIPALQVPQTVAVSMAAIDYALQELVERMEREIVRQGGISSESASELRSHRLGAEQLLAAQTEISQ